MLIIFWCKILNPLVSGSRENQNEWKWQYLFGLLLFNLMFCYTNWVFGNIFESGMVAWMQKVWFDTRAWKPEQSIIVVCLRALFGMLGCIVFVNLFLGFTCQLLSRSLWYFLHSFIMKHHSTLMYTSSHKPHHATACNRFPRTQSLLPHWTSHPIFCWDLNKPWGVSVREMPECSALCWKALDRPQICRRLAVMDRARPASLERGIKGRPCSTSWGSKATITADIPAFSDPRVPWRLWLASYLVISCCSLSLTEITHH